MTHIILARHGTTEWNVPGRLNSFTDLALNETGRSEASKLAHYLASTYPDPVLWCSPARRAEETANSIAKALATKPTIIPDSVEVNFGRFEGKTQHEIAAGQESRLYELWEEGEDLDGVESLPTAAERAKRVFERIIGESNNDLNVLVTHGVFIRVFICVNALGLLPSGYRKLVVDNASLSIVQISDRGTRLLRLNDTSFL